MNKNILLSLVMIVVLALADTGLMVPNDPLRDIKADDLHALSAGYGWQDWLEEHPPAEGIEDIVAVVGDTGGNFCDKNLQIKNQCLLGLAKNFTDEPNFADNNPHAFNVIAGMIAAVNDHMSTASAGGYRGHFKVVPDKAIRSDNSTTSSFYRRVYQHALDLKDQGVNVRMVVLAVSGFGDSDQKSSLDLIRKLAAKNILLMVGAGFNGVNLDEAAVKLYPAAYAATEPNVIAVAATDSSGSVLEPTSPRGPKTVRWAALGRNFQVPYPEDDLSTPQDETLTETTSFSGTSAAVSIAAGIVGATMANRSRVLAKVIRRVDSGCVAVPGVAFGRPRLDKALEDKQVVLLQALEAISNLAEPAAKPSLGFNSDGRNRLALFVENVDSPLGAGEITVTFKDSKDQVLSESLEFVGEIPGQEWVTQVVLKIPLDLAPGPVAITLTARGASSTITKNIV